MKKNTLLLLTSMVSVCAIVGTVFAINSGVNKSAAYAIERPVTNPYVMYITNFTENGYNSNTFVGKTETGYGINFRCNNYGGPFIISESELTVPSQSMIYNEIARYSSYGGMNNAINQMTSLTVTFNEGGQLHLDAYWYEELGYCRQYTESANLTSSVPFDFLATYKEGMNLPNEIEIKADKDTTITSIRIEYLCH